MIKRLCVIGVGLIGGSLALALKRAGYCETVVGYGRNEVNLQQAVDLNVIDSYSLTIEAAVCNADMIFVAVPLAAMPSVFSEIAKYASPDAIITDGGSAKQSVIDAARLHLGAHLPQFVPGHPIAGAENSGVTAAKVDLYDQRRILLTPFDELYDDALMAVRNMWQATGAIVDELPADIHDLTLAGTSHLPHILAFALVECLSKNTDPSDAFRYAAGGFKDFTRIAASDPTMWRDISIANADAIKAMIEEYQAVLNDLHNAIEQHDGDTLFDLFSRVKKIRDDFSF